VPTLPAIKKLPGSPARTGFFERSEITAVISFLPDYAWDLVLMGYLTGWRYGELVSLRWSDVDLDAKLIRLRAEESKNAHGRVIAVEGELLELLRRRQAARLLPTLLDRIKMLALVFHRKGKPIGRIDRSWATACKKAGVPGRLFLIKSQRPTVPLRPALLRNLTQIRRISRAGRQLRERPPST